MEFLLIGSGWRAEFFIRLAEKVPQCFSISSIVTTNEMKQQAFMKRGFHCVKTIAEGVSYGNPQFAVVSVHKEAAAKVALEVLAYGMPVLAETTPASTYEGLVDFCRSMPEGAKYQVAEQYYLKPDHASRLACVDKGIIGEPVQALISQTQSYHAISLMRKYLRSNGADAVIRGQRFPIVGKPGFARSGVPKEIKAKTYNQTLATFMFGDKVGIYNFEDDQHRSFIRSQHIQIKGDNGEINNDEVRYLKGDSPIYTKLIRMNKGENENMEGIGLKGILWQGDWVYQNPYEEVALSDDELAVADCLVRMDDHCNGGASSYNFAEAAQDFYLAILLEEAVRTGGEIRAKEQPWTHLL